MQGRASLRARLFEWIFWRVDFKNRKFGFEGLRERVLKSRGVDSRPPKSFYRRFQVSERSHDGRRVFTLLPRRQEARARMLYLHGGGYVLEAEAPQWNTIAKLMAGAPLSMTIPCYPLAPEHTCEETLKFAIEVYTAFEKEAGGLPLILAGDSAGAGLALALAHLLRDQERRLPARLVLICPWLDVTCCDPAQLELEKVDAILPLRSMRECGLWYAGALSPSDPRVSPLFGQHDDLPPMLLLTGTHDVLNSDAHRLRQRMERTNSTLILSEYSGMGHDWLAAPIPEAAMAVKEIMRFLELGQG